MKKRVIVIILILALLIDVQRVSAAEIAADDYSHIYSNVGIIYCTDYRLDLVYWTDGHNNFYFVGVEDLHVGDTLAVTMHDNYTENTVKDDVIINYRYSDLTINIDVDYKVIK